MYITAYASISSMAFESEALSFAVNRFRKKTKGHSEHSQIKRDMENFKPGRNPVSYRFQANNMLIYSHGLL